MWFLIRSIFFWIWVFLLLTVLINPSILPKHFTFIFTLLWVHFIWWWINLDLGLYRCLSTWTGTWRILERTIRIFFTWFTLILVFVFCLFINVPWWHIAFYFSKKWASRNNVAFFITSVAFYMERTIIIWINT